MGGPPENAQGWPPVTGFEERSGVGFTTLPEELHFWPRSMRNPTESELPRSGVGPRPPDPPRANRPSAASSP
ncbi:MAG: hypothetical protein Ct9H300mP15_29030 [Gemmatimonadota bacterium]|nr:MAG: hypothetical protein Ct9H300mP15_29030 [Gemmatimonadota bacterium]